MLTLIYVSWVILVRRCITSTCTTSVHLCLLSRSIFSRSHLLLLSWCYNSWSVISSLLYLCILLSILIAIEIFFASLVTTSAWIPSNWSTIKWIKVLATMLLLTWFLIMAFKNDIMTIFACIRKSYFKYFLAILYIILEILFAPIRSVNYVLTSCLGRFRIRIILSDHSWRYRMMLSNSLSR